MELVKQYYPDVDGEKMPAEAYNAISYGSVFGKWSMEIQNLNLFYIYTYFCLEKSFFLIVTGNFFFFQDFLFSFLNTIYRWAIIWESIEKKIAFL